MEINTLNHSFYILVNGSFVQKAMWVKEFYVLHMYSYPVDDTLDTWD